MRGMNIYEVSKYVKSEDPESTEENLVTGILCWALERDVNILKEILRLCRGHAREDGKGTLTLCFPEAMTEDHLDIDFQMTLLSGTEYGIPDFGIDDGETFLIGEAKVVTEAIGIDQILGYYGMGKNKFDNRNIFVLLITPDKNEYVAQMLKQIPPQQRNRFFWIPWEEIWRICKRERGENVMEDMVRKEVKEGIEMAGLKPFEGFDDDVIEMARNMKKLEQMTEFFKAIENVLTEPGGLSLESEGTLHYSTKDRTFVEDLYKVFWHRKWKNKDIYSASLGVDIQFLPEPNIGGFLWFRSGKAVTAFRKIHNQCKNIERDLKRAFEMEDVDAGLYVASEADFYVRVPMEDEITKKPEDLQNFITRVLRFFLENTVPSLQKLGYEF